MVRSIIDSNGIPNNAAVIEFIPVSKTNNNPKK